MKLSEFRQLQPGDRVGLAKAYTVYTGGDVLLNYFNQKKLEETSKKTTVPKGTLGSVVSNDGKYITIRFDNPTGFEQTFKTIESDARRFD
jgi:hypothetical protein